MPCQSKAIGGVGSEGRAELNQARGGHEQRSEDRQPVSAPVLFLAGANMESLHLAPPP